MTKSCHKRFWKDWPFVFERCFNMTLQLCDVVAINSRSPIDILAYLFEYDSVHRRYPGKVEVEGDNMMIADGHNKKVSTETDLQAS